MNGYPELMKGLACIFLGLLISLVFGKSSSAQLLGPEMPGAEATNEDWAKHNAEFTRHQELKVRIETGEGMVSSPHISQYENSEEYNRDFTRHQQLMKRIETGQGPDAYPQLSDYENSEEYNKEFIRHRQLLEQIEIKENAQRIEERLQFDREREKQLPEVFAKQNANKTSSRPDQVDSMIVGPEIGENVAAGNSINSPKRMANILSVQNLKSIERAVMGLEIQTSDGKPLSDMQGEWVVATGTLLKKELAEISARQPAYVIEEYAKWPSSILNRLYRIHRTIAPRAASDIPTTIPNQAAALRRAAMQSGLQPPASGDTAKILQARKRTLMGR